MIRSHPSAQLGACHWIDLLAPSAEEIEKVQRETGMAVPTKAAISEIESTSRLGFEDGAFHLSTPLLTHHEDGELVMAPVGFALSPKLLITVRFEGIPLFDGPSEIARAEQATSADEAFIKILEIAVDRSADALEKAGAECDALSHQAFRSADSKKDSAAMRKALTRIGVVAIQTSRLRDSLLGLGRIAAFTTESELAGAPKLNPARMKAIRADVLSLTDYEAHLSGKIQFLLDASLGFINIEQNEIVKTLTIASVVGIPPVLIAGIYGMNFKYMPELGWKLGYPLALGLMVLTGFLPWVWFKKRGWMD